jgi:hypothetical protein
VNHVIKMDRKAEFAVEASAIAAIDRSAPDTRTKTMRKGPGLAQFTPVRANIRLMFHEAPFAAHLVEAAQQVWTAQYIKEGRGANLISLRPGGHAMAKSETDAVRGRVDWKYANGSVV